MGVIRTALAVGALAISVPLYAQPGRYGTDRSRADRGGDSRGARNDRRAEPRERRGEPRAEPRDDGRAAPRVRVPDAGWDRRDRRDEPRVAVRPPVVIERYDHRGSRYGPPMRYSPPVRYRYGDHDYRQRDRFTITAWFRTLPPARLTAYGYYGPSYAGVRYAFRPGIYLSLGVYSHLGVLPYDLELELGELPWYLERRIYGNTVLVIDSRTRMVVDIYELDD